MSWLRLSDTVAYDPRTLAPLERDDADERLVDECFGFSARLAAECGSKETDGRASRAMALTLAGSVARMNHLMGILSDAGVWRPHPSGGWELVSDAGYLHLRAQDEIERDRIRGRDSRDDLLTVPARLRDGDNCRYCGAAVNWSDRKSLRGATWEHVNIANQPTRLEEFVVACFGCNREPSNRGELLPPPKKPRYGVKTREFVRQRLGKWPTTAEIEAMYPGLRPSTENATDHLRSDEENAASSGLRPSSEYAVHDLRSDEENAVHGPRERPANAAENAAGTPTRDVASRAPVGPPEAHDGRSTDDHLIRGLTDLDPSGRDGTGKDSPSQVATTTGEPRPARRSRRSRRAPAQPSHRSSS